MKKTLLALLIMATFISCNNSKNTETATTTAVESESLEEMYNILKTL